MKLYQSKKNETVFVKAEKIDDLPYYTVIEPNWFEPYILEEEVFFKYFTDYEEKTKGLIEKH